MFPARIAASAGLLLCSTAFASGLGPAMAPAEAVTALSSYCLETDAKTAKAEAAITALRLPAEAIVLSNARNGVSLKLDLGGGARLDVDMEGSGHVRACTLKAELSDAKATFLELQKRLQVGGNVEDYEPGNKEWTDLVTPGGTKVSMHVSFAVTSTVSGETRGQMTATVMPEQ